MQSGITHREVERNTADLLDSGAALLMRQGTALVVRQGQVY